MLARRLVALVISFLPATGFAGYRISSWIPGWDANALTVTQTHAGKMSESNPTWYRFDSSGSLLKKTNAEDPTWRSAMTGTEVLPTVQNNTSAGFDKELAVGVLATPEARERHAEEIRLLVRAQVYDGIDIDYERLPYSSRNDFTEFIRLLRDKLHADGKKLSVTLYAKTSEADSWDGPGGEDYAALGALADWVKLMVYDYHYDGSVAGPLTPLDWLDRVLTYAESTIPSSKIMVGLPWYGYDWSGTAATGVSYPRAIAIAQENSAAITHDINGEATYTYAGRTVFFNDAVSYNTKVDHILSRHPNVGGFAHWYNGSEEPAVWTRVESLKNGSSPLPPPPAPAPSGALIPAGATWRYLDNGSDQGTAWRAGSFNDTSWPAGAAQLGYGEGDETTTLSYGTSSTNKFVTSYFRRSFDIADPGAYTSLSVRLMRDDGAVVYLNGVEVWRSNMPSGTIGYRTFAASNISVDESAFHTASIDRTLLLSGKNVIAVEVHQSDAGSSDVSFDLELTGDVSPVALAAPSSLTTSASSPSQIDMTWNDNSSTETGFKVERCDGTQAACETTPNFSEVARLAADVRTWSNTGLPAVTSFTYRVRAFDANGDSGPSNAASATTLIPPPPAAPSSLTASASSTSEVTLSWSDQSSSESGFRIERCDGACTTGFVQIAEVGANVTSYMNSGLAAGTTYSYRVLAYDTWSTSAYSNTSQVTTLAPPPPPASTGPVTFIAKESTWKYLDNGSNQGTVWTAPNFSDSAWKSGQAQFGYGDGDERTKLSYGKKSSNKYVTTYFRREFDVVDPAAFQSLLVSLMRDDGAVVYLNGVEIFRSNMPAGTIGYRTYASTAVVPPDESTFFEHNVSNLLVKGRNVLAVELHQSDASSSDVSFDLELIGK